MAMGELSTAVVAAIRIGQASVAASTCVTSMVFFAMARAAVRLVGKVLTVALLFVLGMAA